LILFCILVVDSVTLSCKVTIFAPNSEIFFNQSPQLPHLPDLQGMSGKGVPQLPLSCPIKVFRKTHVLF
jgi:hypothetical protein